MSYSLLRSLLFKLSPETSHDLSLEWMSAADRLGLLKPFTSPVADMPVEVMGITFPNPVGLAAGLDKNADHVGALGRFGFGSVEVGTVTPRPQPGNPKPRLFRLEKQNAIINRMGFNNKGLEHLLASVRRANYPGIIGINIGKNFDTPVENANDDYIACLKAVYPHASYVTVNVSSPNTPGLRSLQFGEALDTLLNAVKEEQGRLSQAHGRYVPVAIKVAPDMNEEEVKTVAAALLAHEIDGLISGNTTLDRRLVQDSEFADEAGGLSGGPLTDRSCEVIRQFKSELGEQIPIIGVGGIMTGEDALDKIRAGAKLVQLYTGFIYAGPRLVRDCVEAIRFGVH
ncbi:MAG: quinone-dependent dihydroorotate dehydrogenase [Oleiphilus sp.]|nr:MAG: quinone-dependent dihydroorotate dehydrogenase [Oleiphilus sp.]